MQIHKYAVLIPGKILTFISLRLTYHCIRKGLTVLALKVLIVSPPKLSCDVKSFKLDLGKYLLLKSFCTPQEYFNSAKP
jgi:hypothetical protein